VCLHIIYTGAHISRKLAIPYSHARIDNGPSDLEPAGFSVKPRFTEKQHKRKSFSNIGTTPWPEISNPLRDQGKPGCADGPDVALGKVFWQVQPSCQVRDPNASSSTASKPLFFCSWFA
jgi:hypothetical protein